MIGRAGGLPFVVGESGLSAAARPLLGFLDRFPDAHVCAPHFGGVTDVAIFDRDELICRLFGHPRLLVIFSRQGAQDQALIGPWAHELVRRVGWSRLLFGSEYPVALWRDETYPDTLAWIDSVGLRPTVVERAAFENGNAPAGPVRRIGLPDQSQFRPDFLHYSCARASKCRRRSN